MHRSFFATQYDVQTKTLDEGILAAFKKRYTVGLCQEEIFLLESNKDIEKEFNLFSSLNIAVSAWENIRSETIINFWGKSGLMPKERIVH